MSDQQPTEQTPLAQAAPPAERQIQTDTVKPVMTYVIMGVTVLVFIAQLLVQKLTGYDLLFLYLGKIREAILVGQLWRLVTPILLHGSVLHIGFNMYALYVLGTRLEGIYGHWRFLLLYLLAGFGGNVLSFVLTPAASLGSSTAIFGLLAAEVVFILQNRQFFGQRTGSMLMNLVMIMLVNLVIGLNPSMNIDNYGHLGGLLAGLIFASLAGPKWKLQRTELEVRLVDIRGKKEIWVAAAIVFIGFGLMAAIPFLPK
ncbi:MAG: rhomboid family intramembrane serine protease [Anaerolineaceae bacterium]